MKMAMNGKKKEKQVLEEDNDGPESESDLDLDFHIQFPTPLEYRNAGKEDNGNESVSEIENIWPMPEEAEGVGITGGNGKRGDEKEIVVVLLGWAGSQHKNLSKYSDFYLKRGCIVLRYITPVKALFVQTSKLSVLSHRLLRLIHDLQLESHPIFFHVFSNGGSMTYSCMLREIQRAKGKLDLNIQGTIFDSAPSPRNLVKCFIAVKNIFENLGAVKYIIAALAVLSIVFQICWVHFKSAIQLCFFGEQLSSIDPERYHAPEIPLKNWLARMSKTRHHHYLFLYSDNDELIPWDLVEEFADITASQGNFVVKKKFSGSPHVLHYRQYPKEYICAVTDFIRQTMKAKKEPTCLWDGV